MDIKHAVIHRIIKEQYATSAELVANDKELTINEPAKRLIVSVRDIYSSKTGKTYGVFDPAATQTFKDQANAYITNEADFLSYTLKSVEHLALRRNVWN